jgi:hypothetical protein
MTAFNFPSAQAAKTETAARQGSTNKRDLPPAEYWLNVGITLTLPVGENGADEEVFISLGGVALDSIEPVSVRSNSTDRWATIAAAKNEVLAILKADTATLDKGQAAVHPMLQVEARRVGEAAVAAAPANVVSLVAKAMGKAAA